MSRKNAILPLVIMDAVDLEESQVSSVVNIQWLDNIGIQVDVTGSTADGTFTVQVSNTYKLNPDGSVRDAGTWVDLTTPAPIEIVDAEPQPIFIDVNQSGAAAIRLVFEPAEGAGAGTATARLTAKAL